MQEGIKSTEGERNIENYFTISLFETDKYSLTPKCKFATK